MRTSLPKSIRFEILKRDKFTCQYCGSKAPGVILHVDHVNPVAEGGTDDIFNLVSSCVDCNLGKGARPLNKTDILDAQRASMEDREERRLQLEMISEWQAELADLRNKEATIAVQVWNSHDFPPLNGDEEKLLAKVVRRFGVVEVVGGIEKLYVPPEASSDSRTTIKRLASLLASHRQPQSEQDVRYLCGTAIGRGFSMKTGIPDQLREAVEAGFTREQLKRVVLSSHSNTDLGQKLYNLIEDKKEAKNKKESEDKKEIGFDVEKAFEESWGEWPEPAEDRFTEKREDALESFRANITNSKDFAAFAQALLKRLKAYHSEQKPKAERRRFLGAFKNFCGKWREWAPRSCRVPSA